MCTNFHFFPAMRYFTSDSVFVHFFSFLMTRSSCKATWRFSVLCISLEYVGVLIKRERLRTTETLKMLSWKSPVFADSFVTFKRHFLNTHWSVRMLYSFRKRNFILRTYYLVLVLRKMLAELFCIFNHTVAPSKTKGMTFCWRMRKTADFLYDLILINASWTE